MGKLNDSRSIYIDDSDETGARRKYRFFGIAQSPAGAKLRERSCIKPDGQNLGELFDAKWSNSYSESLEESVCELSFYLVDPT